LNLFGTGNPVLTMVLTIVISAVIVAVLAYVYFDYTAIFGSAILGSYAFVRVISIYM
jgi:hypothetical protein